MAGLGLARAWGRELEILAVLGRSLALLQSSEAQAGSPYTPRCISVPLWGLSTVCPSRFPAA